MPRNDRTVFWVSTVDVNLWTGLNDLGMQGFFTWSDQHWVSFTYWAPGEPNNHASVKEDCVEILHEVRGPSQMANMTKSG